VLDDLAALPRERWAAVSYAEFIAAPRVTVERLCRFIGVEVSPALRARLAGPLPWSRFTHTAPAPGKWAMNAAAIERVLPQVAATWQRLQAL